MVDSRLVGAWANLLKTMRGSREAMDALLPLAAGLTRDQVTALVARASAPAPGAPVQPIEQFWRVMGVVPRYRYDELLQRYETLRARLEEAETTIQQLRKLLEKKGREKEARQVLDTWGSGLSETLRAQTQFWRSLVSLEGESGDSPASPKRTSGSSRSTRVRKSSGGAGGA